MPAVCCDKVEQEGCNLYTVDTPCDDATAEMQMKMIMDPFIASTTQPKYPDGKAQWSIGVKYQMCTEVRAHNFFGLLFPGVNNWFVAFDVQEIKATADPPHPAREVVRLLANHNTRNRSHSVTFNTNVLPATQNGKTQEPADYSYEWHPHFSCPYNSWRPVFCGLRVMHVSSKEEDNGCFDCFRTTRDGLMEMFSVARKVRNQENHEAVNTDIGPNVENGNLLPILSWALRYMGNTGDRETEAMPSYSYNNYASLMNYTFQLNHIRDENDFIKLETVLRKRDAQDTWYNPTWDPVEVPDFTTRATEWVARKANPPEMADYQETRPATDEYTAPELTPTLLAADDPSSTSWWANGYGVKPVGIDIDDPMEEARPEFENQFLSEAFDVIVMRFRGDENSRFTFHTSYAQEYLVNEDSQLASFQTPAYNYQTKLHRYQETRKLYHKIPYHFQTNEGKQGVFKDMY